MLITYFVIICLLLILLIIVASRWLGEDTMWLIWLYAKEFMSHLITMMTLLWITIFYRTYFYIFDTLNLILDFLEGKKLESDELKFIFWFLMVNSVIIIIWYFYL